MEYKIQVEPLALIDIDEAAAWYNKKIVGLGQRFLLNLQHALFLIGKNPSGCKYISKPIRRCLVKRFPYKIFYSVNDTTIFIIAVVHSKRSNKYVKRRIN